MACSRWRIAIRPLLGWLTISCQSEPTTPDTKAVAIPPPVLLLTDNVVATLAVTPDSQMAFVGDQFKVTAKPKNAAGQLLTKTVRWTVSDLRIAKPLDSLKATVRFKGLRAGITSIKATVDGKTKSSKAVVRSTSGAKIVVTPATASVPTGGTVQFVAGGLTAAGEKLPVNVTWTATGGTISSTGVLKAGTVTGKYRVIATSRFGAKDTSSVSITSAPKPVSKVVLVPATATLASGATAQFFAYGRTSAGDSVPVSATYTATGGTIATSGGYTAGSTAGTFRVIAKISSGLADTSSVTIAPAEVQKLTLLPGTLASRPDAVTRFSASGGSSTALAQPLSYSASCGAITATGVYSAPPTNGGTCRVVASRGDEADTTEVRLLSNSRTRGSPLGLLSLWTSATTTPSSGVAPFTASHGPATPSQIITQISAARSKGIHLILSMTGGAHSTYETDGVFDLAKWQAAMDKFNTSAIRAAVSDGVADGTIIGNSVMDEPHHWSWGPKGTMTRARVDGLCAYVKAIFPTLPVGVFHDAPKFDPTNIYNVCEFLMAHYSFRKGDIAAWRDAQVTQTTLSHMSVMLGLNIVNGGKQDKDGTYDCAGTGGMGSYYPNCAMTPEQIRTWGRVLVPVGCGLTLYRYDALLDQPATQAAVSDIAIALSDLPRIPCTGSRAPNTPPTPVFAFSCSDLTCSFTETSFDGDGAVTGWSWDFGDGSTSDSREPSHAYTAAGIYEVVLTVTDDDGAPQSVTHSVTVAEPPPANRPPLAAFTASCNDLACSFADGSGDDDGSVASWSWDFGDGASSSAASPSHDYTEEGSYEVTLTVTDDDGATGTVKKMVTVTAPPPANKAPTAAFTASCNDLACSFTDGSKDEDGSVAGWSWDFGDGKSSTNPSPSHDYTEDGSYEVTLTVTDDAGATDVVKKSVTVSVPPPPPVNDPPTARFSFSCANLDCSFSDESVDQDGTVVSWTWDFGDGVSSAERNPTHTFEQNGSYEVKLVATDDDGDTGTVAQTVAAPPAEAP